MKKYYPEFIRADAAGVSADGCVYKIHEYDTRNGERVYKNGVFIYHSALKVSELFDTIPDAIKSLNGSRRPTILPDGSIIIPEEVNYPDSSKEIFETWYPSIRELIPGEY